MASNGNNFVTVKKERDENNRSSNGNNDNRRSQQQQPQTSQQQQPQTSQQQQPQTSQQQQPQIPQHQRPRTPQQQRPRTPQQQQSQNSQQQQAPHSHQQTRSNGPDVVPNQQNPPVPVALRQLAVITQGVMFSELRAIPTSPTLDCPPGTCFRCRLLGHCLKDCPYPSKTVPFCRNCGRHCVMVENCPRCYLQYQRLAREWNQQRRSLIVERSAPAIIPSQQVAPVQPSTSAAATAAIPTTSAYPPQGADTLVLRPAGDSSRTANGYAQDQRSTDVSTRSEQNVNGREERERDLQLRGERSETRRRVRRGIPAEELKDFIKNLDGLSPQLKQDALEAFLYE